MLFIELVLHVFEGPEPRSLLWLNWNIENWRWSSEGLLLHAYTSHQITVRMIFSRPKESKNNVLISIRIILNNQGWAGGCFSVSVIPGKGGDPRSNVNGEKTIGRQQAMLLPKEDSHNNMCYSWGIKLYSPIQSHVFVWRQTADFTEKSSTVTCNFNCRSKLNVFKRHIFLLYFLLEKLDTTEPRNACINHTYQYFMHKIMTSLNLFVLYSQIQNFHRLCMQACTILHKITK